MEHVNFVKFREHLSDYVGQVRFAGKRLIVTHRGKAAGAFIPIEDLETIQSLEDKMDAEIVQKALKSGEFEDWEIVKKRLLNERGAVEDEIHPQNRKASGKVSKKGLQSRSSEAHASNRRTGRKSKTQVGRKT